MNIPPVPGQSDTSGAACKSSGAPPLPGQTVIPGGPTPNPADVKAQPKIILNVIVAGILTVFAGWITITDFSHSGDLLFQTSPSSLLAGLFASFVLFVLIVVAALPKRMIIGANLLLLMRCSMGFPLNLWLANTPAARISTIAFLVLSLGYLFMSLVKACRLPSRPWVQGKHSAIAAVAWVLVTILSVPAFVIGYVAATRNFLGDYLDVSLSGVELVERVFEKDGQKVHLVGMMHVGDGTYYRDLKRRMHASPPAGQRRLVLTEGVSDRDRILPADFANGNTYERWAKLLGLESQKSLGPSESPRSTPQDLSSPEPGEPADSNITWQNADGDIADMKESHRMLLVELLESMASADIAALFHSKIAQATGEQIEDFMRNGLIISRNEVLMRHFLKQGPEFTEVWIPWGAAHLPDIERRLLGMGYRQTETAKRPIVRFWK